MATWTPKTISPSFKLNFGTSESGARITKSVTIRNCNPDALDDNETKTALNNIISQFVNDTFERSIYQVILNASYYWEEY